MDSNYQQPPQQGQQPSSDPKKAKQATNLEIQKWLKRISASDKLRDKVAADYNWRDIVDEFHNKYNWSRWGLSDIYIPPLALSFAYVQSEIPALYFRDPHIKVNPKNEKSVDAAKIMEKAINYIWRHQRIKRENTKNLQDTLLVGHSWFKTGYRGDFGTIEDANGTRFEFIEKEEFFGYRIPWESIYFNPDSIDPPFDCTWIAHEIWAAKEDIEKNPLYDKDVVAKLQVSSKKNKHSVVIGSVDYGSYISEVDEGMCCLYEVWDKSTQTKFTISPGTLEYLEAPKQWPYQLRGFPFSYLCFNPSPSFPYGIPDVYTFRPQLLELMKLYASMLDHVKRLNRQYLVKEGAIDADAMAQLKKGVTGAIIQVDDINSVSVLQYPPFPQDAYVIEKLLKEVLINVSGQSATDRGATQPTASGTFKELSDLQKSGQNRRSRKVDLIEQFIEDIASNMIALLQQLADVPFYVRLTGDEFQAIQQALSSRPSANVQGAIAGPNGFTFTKDDISGEFDLEVVAGSTMPLDRTQTMQTINQIIPEFPALGVMPGGPVAQAIGSLLAENLEIPQLEKAMQDEAALKQQMQQRQQQQMQDQQALNVAETTGKLNIDAARVGVKQNALVIDAMKHLTTLQQQKEQGDKQDNGSK